MELLIRTKKASPLLVLASPLLRLVALAGGPAAVGVTAHSAEEKAYERALRDGWVTLYAADVLACHVVGLSPVLVWGKERLDAIETAA